MNTSSPTAYVETTTKHYFWTNVIIVVYLFFLSAKWVAISLMNLIQVPSDLNSSTLVPFDFPFLQIVAAYVGEFVFTIFYFIHMAFVMRVDVKNSEIRFVQFLYPALCDFLSNIFFILGMGQLLPTLSIMTKTAALPLTVLFTRWSLVKINKTYDTKQTVSIAAIFISAVLLFLATVGIRDKMIS